MPEPLARSIADEAGRLGLEVSAESSRRLAAYAASLWSWNERLNLTRHTDVHTFVSRDVADAAAIEPHLARGEHVLDVGTGGGVPGVMLAILRPDLRVELCDSVAKKARAVSAIVAETGLALPVHAAAGQAVVAAAVARGDRFDTLVVRAVAPLVKLLAWFEPLGGEFGRMLVIKGPRWEEEKGEARHKGFAKRVTVRRIAAWPIRGGDNESVLLEIRPKPPLR
ncbi:MAG: 16S rRNA (guanine(527)-N(7))-methyltransferase RsmG [Planctomycetia bacterium]|nr:16S rRNA (guanine(527)-N(7))-methyltransferase RsmG [Planctomycetia bacterium]